MKRVLVALPDGIVALLDNELSGKLGEGKSDTLRNYNYELVRRKGLLNEGWEMWVRQRKSLRKKLNY